MKNQEEEINHIQIYKRLFKTKDGEVVLRDLLRTCNFFTGTFQSDHAVMAFEEGRRSVVMDILRTIQLDLEEIKQHYLEMSKEDKKYGEF